MIDAHHHIWLQKDLPWLLGPEQPRIFGEYASIKRDYSLAEYQADAAAAGVTQSVYVQANWAPNWAQDEVAWVEAEADNHGMIGAIVGYADFNVDDVRPALERLKPYPRMRGLRQQLHWHENPAYRFAAHAEMAREPRLQRNIARLADYNWSFDLQVFPAQMAGAAELAAACPEVTFILQHAGMLEDTSEAGWHQWREGMKRLSDRPNVVNKLSGLGTFMHRCEPAFIEQLIQETLTFFSAERCLFGSNFPIEKMWTSYADLFSAYQTATASLSKKQRRAIFHDTAARVYRLSDTEGDS
jgi:predicted TIM-barrel fold metal-dependent hydrolase